MTKITKTTFKSFIKKNAGKLYILTSTTFDGMVDGRMSTGQKTFQPITFTDVSAAHTFGIDGVWLVGGSRDYFSALEGHEGFEGIECVNCCGKFAIAIKS